MGSDSGDDPTGSPEAANAISAEIDAIVEEAEAALAADAPSGESAASGSELARIGAERDDYLDALRRLQADFDNYRKRVAKEAAATFEKGAERLTEKLLPVLDTADLAIAHGGGEAIRQVWGALFDVLAKEGLERLDPEGQPFDPTEHDAVLHEDGDGGPVVDDVLRAGYRFKGRLLRPAMVKVKGS